MPSSISHTVRIHGYAYPGSGNRIQRCMGAPTCFDGYCNEYYQAWAISEA